MDPARHTGVRLCWLLAGFGPSCIVRLCSGVSCLGCLGYRVSGHQALTVWGSLCLQRLTHVGYSSPISTLIRAKVCHRTCSSERTSHWAVCLSPMRPLLCPALGTVSWWCCSGPWDEMPVIAFYIS